MPGFVDSHNHIRLGSGEGAVQLAGATTLDEVRAPDRRRGSSENPERALGDGRGLRLRRRARMAVTRAPSTSTAPPAAGPAMLLDYSVHAAWFNREALDRLGVGPRRRRGSPYGTLRDRRLRASRPATSRTTPPTACPAPGSPRCASWSPPSASRRSTTGSAPGCAMAARLGHHHGGRAAELPGRPRPVPARARRGRAALARGRRPVPPASATTRRRARRVRRRRALRTHDDRFRVGPLKLYIDDIVEPHTAAMLEPVREPSRHPRPDLLRAGASSATWSHGLDARGFQCFVHATGDRGIQVVLDAFEHARRVNGARDSRHQIVHVECLDAADVPPVRRAGRRGVHAAAALRAGDRRRVAGQRRPAAVAVRLADAQPGRRPAPPWRSRRTGTSRRWTRWSASTPRSPARRSTAASPGCPRSGSTSRPRCAATPSGRRLGELLRPRPRRALRRAASADFVGAVAGPVRGRARRAARDHGRR